MPQLAPPCTRCPPRSPSTWQHKPSGWQALQSQPGSWQRTQDARLSLCVTPASGVGAPQGSGMFTYLLKWLAGVQRGVTPAPTRRGGLIQPPGAPGLQEAPSKALCLTPVTIAQSCRHPIPGTSPAERPASPWRDGPRWGPGPPATWRRHVRLVEGPRRGDERALGTERRAQWQPSRAYAAGGGGQASSTRRQ